MKNVSAEWMRKRERLLVARVLEAGLEFNSRDIRKIIYEMSYENQKIKNPQDCPCYLSEPCHKNIRDLNCFVCGCPNYDLDIRDERGFIGACNSSKGNGKYLENPSPAENGFGNLIWDCSGCSSYHSPLSCELFLIVYLNYYSSLAETIKKERIEKGFSDFKSFADFLSEDILRRR